MATTLFVSGRIESRKNDGTINSGGKVYFFVVGTTTPQSSYPSKADANAGTNANANPLILDSAGRGIAYVVGDVKVTIHTSADVLIYTQDFVFPVETTSLTSITTPTTLTLVDSGKWIVTTATITLPTASVAGAGWYVYLKNNSAALVTIARGTGSDTIAGTAANISLLPNQSIALIVNSGITGFIQFFNPFMDFGGGVAGKVLGHSITGPQWQTVDLNNTGGKLYLFNNFT